MEYKDGKYTVTLTDTNRVLSEYSLTSSGGVSVSISGNTMTLSSSTPINDAVSVKLNRKLHSTTMTTNFLIWSVPGHEDENQDMVSGVPANDDPVPAFLKLETAAGSAKIVKTSEDSWELDGDLPIGDFLELVDRGEDGFDFESETVGGWVMELNEGYAPPGCVVTYEDLEITVLEADDKRVEKVRVIRK